MDSAWLALGALAHNLARWSARLGQLTEGTCPIALATLRRRFISVPGQLSRSARRTTLHLARNWRWAEAFLVALRALRAVAPRLASSLAPSPTERTEGASDCRAPVRFHPVPKRPSNRENHPEPPLVARSLQPVPEAVRPLSGPQPGRPLLICGFRLRISSLSSNARFHPLRKSVQGAKVIVCEASCSSADRERRERRGELVQVFLG